MGYDGPKIGPNDWSMELEPLVDGEIGPDGGYPWLGTVHFGDRRRAAVVIRLDEAQVETLDFDLRPIELLIAATTPR